MRRALAAVVAIAGLLAVASGVSSCRARREPGDPLDGLTRAQSERFVGGRLVFERRFTEETGLGPLFNAESCGECHEETVAGGSGDEIETHVAAFDAASGACDPLIEHGGPVIQQQATPALKAALGIEGEPVPDAAPVRALRSSPDVFGFGLLDAIPDETILAHADPDDRDGDGISGRPNRFVDGRLGRFGRKALVPTLREFNAGAFVIEQGVTNPDAPTEESIGGAAIPPGVDPVPEPELGREAVELADDFVRFTAPPEARKLDRSGRRGREVFREIGCAGCHIPALQTGDNTVEALRYRTVYAYTDLLLHDMGAELADICLGVATPSEFRTEPLMGSGAATQFLHDGRAKTLEEAIRFHGGEAQKSRTRFEGLSPKDREALLSFLRSL